MPSPLDLDWTEVDVEISDTDCAGAQRRSCYDDPVSRACRHALGWRFHSVAVDGRIIVKQRTGTRRHHGQADCLSDDQPALRAWIRCWDDGGAPETPMLFTLHVPPAWIPAPKPACEKNPRPVRKSP